MKLRKYKSQTCQNIGKHSSSWYFWIFCSPSGFGCWPYFYHSNRKLTVGFIIQEFSEFLKPCLEKLPSRHCHLISSQHLSLSSFCKQRNKRIFTIAGFSIPQSSAYSCIEGGLTLKMQVQEYDSTKSVSIPPESTYSCKGTGEVISFVFPYVELEIDNAQEHSTVSVRRCYAQHGIDDIALGHQFGSQSVKCTGSSAWFILLYLLPFPFWGIPHFDPRLGIDIPVHDASWWCARYMCKHDACATCLHMYLFMSWGACILYLVVMCLTLSRAVWGRPQSVLIFWWVPALVQPSLVPLGCLSVLFFLLHCFLFSPLSRFFLMCTQIFVLSSCIMASVLNGFLNLFFFSLSVQSHGTLRPHPLSGAFLSCLVSVFCLLWRWL